MVQALDNFSKEENIQSILKGTSFAIYEANKDRKNYIKYKYGYTDEFSLDKMKNMELLGILESLGYSLDELGTYLYKDVIKEIYDKISDASSRRDIDKCRALMASLSDAFSGFYYYIAEECKEMGLKSFHLYIKRAIDNIDDSEVDIELSKNIFGENPEENNYGLQAFQIAAYVANKYSYKDVKEYKKVLAKKLPNIPDNISLKEDFSECI